jgi:ethanolamine ammonia-lyase small subunit
MRPGDLPEEARLLAARTPARVATGRAGTRPPTAQLLRLRADHAAASDAVRGEVDPALPATWGCVLSVSTLAADRDIYLDRPEDGRILRPEDAGLLRERVGGCEVLVAVADGLSKAAVEVQAPKALPVLLSALELEGVGTVGGPVFVRNGRVGVVDSLGEATGARLVILLVGERPGLSTAESLSIYFALDPAPGRTDADRNVISNVHEAGIPPVEAAAVAASWAARMLRSGLGGVRFRP